MKDPKGKDISRRDFVKAAAIGIGATSVFTGAGVAEAIVKVPKKWDQEFDVVILGAGGAGLAAAIEARDRGAKTVVLEKMPVVGGSTIICGGALAFAGTDLQEQKNVKDSKELLYKDLMTVGENMNDPVLVQAYVDNQMETYNWLKKIGVKFTSLSIASGMSVPRAHQVIPSDALKVLTDAVKERGGQIVMETSGTKLVMDEKTGKIRGVIAERKGKKIAYGARKSVILASGGFSMNRELVAKFVPPMAKARTLVSPGCNGDGLKMAWAYGADFKDMPYIKATFGYHPESKSTKERAHIYYKGAIIVNKEGKRFVNESISYKLLGDAALAQTDAMGFSVWDAAIKEAAKGDALAPVDQLEKLGLLYIAPTIGELASKMGVPAQTLEESVTEYNANVEKGTDPLGRKTLVAGFGKPVKIEKPPFYAFKSTGVILGTYGGLSINAKAQVLDIFGEAIPGLYAAGEVTGGVHGAAYMTGTAFGKAVIFGRLAGKYAAA